MPLLEEKLNWVKRSWVIRVGPPLRRGIKLVRQGNVTGGNNPDRVFLNKRGVIKRERKCHTSERDLIKIYTSINSKRRRTQRRREQGERSAPVKDVIGGELPGERVKHEDKKEKDRGGFRLVCRGGGGLERLLQKRGGGVCKAKRDQRVPSRNL